MDGLKFFNYISKQDVPFRSGDEGEACSTSVTYIRLHNMVIYESSILICLDVKDTTGVRGMLKDYTARLARHNEASHLANYAGNLPNQLFSHMILCDLLGAQFVSENKIPNKTLQDNAASNPFFE